MADNKSWLQFWITREWTEKCFARIEKHLLPTAVRHISLPGLAERGLRQALVAMVPRTVEKGGGVRGDKRSRARASKGPVNILCHKS